jgi:hypothetical protein
MNKFLFSAVNGEVVLPQGAPVHRSAMENQAAAFSAVGIVAPQGATTARYRAGTTARMSTIARMGKVALAGAMVAVAVPILNSCIKEGDDEVIPTTVAEDKVNIQASFDRVEALIRNAKNGSLYKFGEEFIDYQEKEVTEYWYNYVGQGKGSYAYDYTTGKYVPSSGGGYERGGSYSWTSSYISEFVELLGDKLEDVVDIDPIERDRRFNLASFAGTYTWNNSGEKWDKTSNTFILAKFPAKKGGTGNCEVALTEYADQECDIEGKKTYLPTKAKAYFKKDGVNLVTADIAASYTTYGIPQQVTASVYASPLKIEGSLKQESASKYSAAVSIVDEGAADNNLAITGEVNLSNSISKYDDFDDLDVNTLSFTLKQSDLEIRGTVDVKRLDAISKPTDSDINSCVNLVVFYRGQTTGTLSIADDYLYINYKDGTRENTSVYYDSFVDAVEKMFEN